MANAAWPLLPKLSPLAMQGGLRGRIVQVENTNHCNFHCEYCATHAPGSRVRAPRGHMTMATYRDILDRHATAMLIILQGDGEPLLDPTLFEKIALARKRGMVTQVITNGSMGRTSNLERLVREGPDILLFSIDAVSPQRNMAQRSGLDYEQVTTGIRALTGKRGEQKRKMVVGLLSIVHGAVDEEVAKALRSFNALDIDVLLYKQLNPAFEGRIAGYRATSAGSLPARLRKQLNYPVQHQRIVTVRPCAQLRWDLPYYLWTGQRTACCVLNDPSFTADAFQREALLEGYQSSQLPKECEDCTFFAGYPA